MGIVPAVVHQKRVQHHATLTYKLLSEGVHAIENLWCTEALSPPQIIPGVVVQKCPIRVGSLHLQIRQKVSPHLSSASYTDNGGISNGLVCRKWQHPLEAGDHLAVLCRTVRQRVFKTEIEIAAHDWRSRHLAHNMSRNIMEVKHLHIRDRQWLFVGANRDLLTQIGLISARYQTPVNLRRARQILKVSTQLACCLPVCRTR